MSDSSDSEEFYDAEEYISLRSSKRSSVCSKTISVTDSPELDKDRCSSKHGNGGGSTLSITNPTTKVATSTPASTTPEDDRTTVKNVVQGRRKFQELRRCMQTEEEDELVPDATGSVDQQTFALEHPFKIISHDTMSLQSMTSLGRIGRILSGAAESHPNIRDAAPVLSASSREPSAISDDPPAADCRNQNALAWCEPDVIASTKANSLKLGRAPPAAIVAVAGGPPAPGPAGPADPTPLGPPAAPTAPPRRKRNKLHGSMSLSMAEGDDVSVRTTDTDEFRYVCRAADKTLDGLVLQPPVGNTSSQSLGLPSPASTIESLTREFQDSLELSQAKYAIEMSPRSAHDRTDVSTFGSQRGSHDDSNKSPREHGVEEERVRTHSEGRVTPAAGAGGRGPGGPRRPGARRRSAGDERLEGAAGGAAGGAAPAGGAAQRLTDLQILDQVTVLNLDTGERMPLSEAEHKLPQCINPLSLHIMRLTSEYIGRAHDDENTSPSNKPKKWRERFSVSLYSSSFNVLRKSPSSPIPSADSSLTLDRETDDDSESVCVGGAEDDAKVKKSQSTDRQTTAIKKKTEKDDNPTNSNLSKVKSHSQDNINKKLLTNELNDRLRRFLGSTVRRTVEAARSLAAEVSQARHRDAADEERADDARTPDGARLRLRASASHRGPYDFDGCVRHVQEMSGRGCDHTGAVWCCRFSVCGRLLATAGQDRLLRVWVARDAYTMFQEMRTKYNAEQKCSPSPSQESLPSLGAGGEGAAPPPPPEDAAPPPAAPFCPRPFAVYVGHTSDLLDVSWSKNYFILSSSMDKTVRLWHISRGECLCCFQHIDFVTAIVFHPRDDRYFLSGSLDGKLRLWNIPDKKVAVWNEVDGKTKLITAANFCQNGKFAVVGTYDGRCIFYTTDQLKYHTQIDVRSTRGKNSTGRKISGIEPMPNDDKILITSNDSRIRLYDLRDLNLSCKYKGYVNVSSQIKASFSHDGKYIVSGSENQCIYIWKTYHDYSKFTSVRRDRNDFWEGIKAHNAVVTCAVFAPNPDHMIRVINEREEEARLANKEGDDKDDEMKPLEGGMVSSSQPGHVLVSADFNGCIKVFLHKAKPKHSSLPASALDRDAAGVS